VCAVKFRHQRGTETCVLKRIRFIAKRWQQLFFGQYTMTYISDNANPTIEEVREWGYDEDRLFLDQDEDLILHSPQYIPILIELACDDSCPKKSYCFSILQYYSAIQLSHRTKELADIVSHIRQGSVTSNPDLESWRTKCLVLK